MRIKISKSQWVQLGKAAGWFCKSQKYSDYPVIEKFIEEAQRLGFKYVLPRDGGAYSKGGTTYPTFVTQDGNVKIAIDSSDIYVHRNSVWIADPYERLEDARIIAAIVTNPAMRGKGLASQALRLLVQAADTAGVRLKLEPMEMKGESKKGDPKLKTKQLIEWYKRHGFNIDESGLIMERQPNIKENLDENKDV
jgi:GNAT superfamily N-acetyltransferase